MLQVVLLGLLAVGINGENNPCPTESTIKANYTNCYAINTPKKCDKRYIMTKFQRVQTAVPCEWDYVAGMCQNRLDCTWEPKCPDLSTRVTLPGFQACEDLYFYRDELDGLRCDDLYAERKMTGSIYRVPCSYKREGETDLFKGCLTDHTCWEKVGKTMAPTTNPTFNPTMVPTMPPTTKPTMSPTRVPTFAPSEKPTMSPTRVPTFAPSEKPTEKPTEQPTADICTAFIFFPETCRDFGCYYIDELDLCQAEKPWGYDCPENTKKSKCEKNEECIWKKGKKTCIAGKAPTPSPTMEPTSSPTFKEEEPFCSTNFFNNWTCDDWYQVAGCKWDQVYGICRDRWEKAYTVAPSFQPSKEPTVDICKDKKRQRCMNTEGCAWFFENDGTSKCLHEDTSCYVDFVTFSRFGLTQVGIEECLNKPSKLRCVLEETDPMQCVDRRK